MHSTARNDALHCTHTETETLRGRFCCAICTQEEGSQMKPTQSDALAKMEDPSQPVLRYLTGAPRQS